VGKVSFGAALVAAVMLYGCFGDSGGDYIGKWVGVKRTKVTLVIERNGEGFLIRETAPKFLSDTMVTSNIPASLKDGALQFSNGIGTIEIVIDKSSGHLTDGRNEFKRAD
jgi:hypothetical protein